MERKLHKKLLEAQIDWHDRWADPYEPLRDVDGFYPLGFSGGVPAHLDSRKRGEVLPVYLNEQGLKAIRDLSRQLCAQNEYAISGIENRVSYVIGTGYQYLPVRRKDLPGTEADERVTTGVDPLCARVQDFLDEVLDLNEWGEVEQELVRRCDRDGECFLRLFFQPNGLTKVRFVEPEHVKEPPNADQTQQRYAFGVETEPDDVESVVAYWLVSDPTRGVADEQVAPEEMLHVKLNVDRSAKRGVPTFYPVRKRLERCERIMEAMGLMVQIRSTFALIRKHKGYSESQVESFVNAKYDHRMTDVNNKTRRFERYRPGSVIDVPEGTDYEMPAINSGIAECEVALRVQLRAVASRLGMPEWMLTADASQMGAYTSSMVAESPSVKNFERLQSFYKRKMGAGGYRAGAHAGAVWRMITHAVAAGRLSREVLREVILKVQTPTLVVRNKGEEATVKQVQRMNGVLSVQTWCSQDGLDYEEEQRLVAEHNERTGGQGTLLPLPGQGQPPGQPPPRLPPGMGEKLGEDLARHAPLGQSLLESLLPVPERRQSTDYTCGAACLQACLHYFGLPASEVGVAKAAGTNPTEGTRPDELIGLAQRCGLEASGQTLDMDSLATHVAFGRPVLCPVQAHGGGHWVVVIGCDGKAVTVMDPAAGVQTVPAAAFDRAWHDTDADGVAYVRYGIALSRPEAPVPESIQPRPTRRRLKAIRGQEGLIDEIIETVEEIKPEEATDGGPDV